MENRWMYYVYQNYAAACIYRFIFSFFFLSNFQTLKIFITFFSGTERPRRLKLGTHVDSGQMYRVYWNQATAIYSSLFIFLSLQFSNIKFFFVTLFSGTVRPRRLKLVQTWTVGRCIVYTGIMLLLVFIPLFFHFFFVSNFQTLKIFKHFSQELWGLEHWNLVHTWTVGRCIVYTEIRLLLFIHLFIHFSFSPVFKHKIFCHTFLRNCEA